MILTLYHGSKYIVEKPQNKKGNPHNDYGPGFYCTKERELAMEWAVSRNNDGYANKYSIDTTDLKIYEFDKDNVLEWLAILINNRTFDISFPITQQAKDFLTAHYLKDYSQYDILVGFRADDSYFDFAQDFLSNNISLRQLSRALQLGYLGKQYCIKSKTAFDRIKFESYETSNSKYYERKILRERIAKDNYHNNIINTIESNDIFVIDLIKGKYE